MSNENSQAQAPAPVTTQEIFDRVARHLLTQNRKAQFESGSCAYRAPGGASCAVGCLITDEHYTAAIEGANATNALVRTAVEKSLGRKLDSDKLSLLCRLQEVHDYADVEAWALNLYEVARMFDLSSDVIRELRPDSAAGPVPEADE